METSDTIQQVQVISKLWVPVVMIMEHIHRNTHTQTQTDTHTQTHTLTHTHTHTHMHMHTHITLMHTCMHAQTYLKKYHQYSKLFLDNFTYLFDVNMHNDCLQLGSWIKKPLQFHTAGFIFSCYPFLTYSAIAVQQYCINVCTYTCIFSLCVALAFYCARETFAFSET